MQGADAACAVAVDLCEVGRAVADVLLAVQDKTNGEIAKELGMSRQKAGRWRKRYQALGLAGIEKDAPRPGRRRAISPREAVMRPLAAQILLFASACGQTVSPSREETIDAHVSVKAS